MEDQQDILVDLRSSWMDAEQGNWTSPDAQKVFHTLVIQMAEYVDEPNRLATSLQQMTPQKGDQCDDKADPKQDERTERIEQIVRFLLSSPSLTDQWNPVIESWKSDQLWSSTRLKWLRDVFAGLVSCMFFCLNSVCMCSVLTMVRNDSSRALVVLGEEDGVNQVMLTKSETLQSLPEDVGMIVLAPVQTAIQRINHIEIPEDREHPEDAKALSWFGIGESPFVEHEDSTGRYPRTFRCCSLWIRILSRVHFRLLLGIFTTSIYLLIYSLIFKKLFEDLFVIEGTKCRDSEGKMWECKVALIRRLLGITALVTYLGTTAVILRHYGRFDRVMQVEMDILEMEDFKMDMEALDGGMFGASDEAKDLLDEVKAQLERRLRIVRKFRHTQRNLNDRDATNLPKYKDLSKRLAAATEEPQQPDQSRGSQWSSRSR